MDSYQGLTDKLYALVVFDLPLVTGQAQLKMERLQQKAEQEQARLEAQKKAEKAPGFHIFFQRKKSVRFVKPVSMFWS